MINYDYTDSENGLVFLIIENMYLTLFNQGMGSQLVNQ